MLANYVKSDAARSTIGQISVALELLTHVHNTILLLLMLRALAQTQHAPQLLFTELPLPHFPCRGLEHVTNSVSDAAEQFFALRAAL